MVFAADDRSVSGDGAVFDAALSRELLRDCDLVSVLGVQEKCDEKGQALTRLAFPCRHFETSRENNFRCLNLQKITLDNRESPHGKRSEPFHLHGYGKEPEIHGWERG